MGASLSSNNDRARAEVVAVINDIARIQREIGSNHPLLAQAEDHEAGEILRRIERRLMGRSQEASQ